MINKLELIKIFCTVAETLHFRDSAQRLAVSPQVVSRGIHELEAALGEVLFQRSTRQVKLSDFGMRFLPQARQLLADSEALFSQSRHRKQEQRIAGLVRVAVPEMALMQQVLGDLWDKLADYPDLTLDWRSSLNLADVVDEQIDVGIRFGTPEDSRLVIRKVGTAQDCIVAAPSCWKNRYTRRLAKPATPPFATLPTQQPAQPQHRAGVVLVSLQSIPVSAKPRKIYEQQYAKRADYRAERANHRLPALFDVPPLSGRR